MAIVVTTTAVTEITANSAKTGGSITGMTEEFFPITHRLLINKFQLRKACCQKLSGSVRNTSFLKPFMLFEDSKQTDSEGDKKFVLTAYSYRPMSQIYEDISLSEYDNTTDMTINIV